MLKHSKRARRNTRDGINLRIGTIEVKIKEIKAEIKLYTRLGHTPYAKRVLRTLIKKLATRKSQLARYYRRKARLKQEGKI